MIFVGKCPYRISLLGGGSDLEWFVKEEGYGNSLGFSLDKFSYSVINKKEKNSLFGLLNYSSREIYSSLDDIAHPLIRESLKYLEISHFLEFSSFGFSTGGGGLGGSSSFCMSFLAALSSAFDLNLDKKNIAHICSEIEINVLGKPIGRQDQYLSSLGGINALLFKENGKVIIDQLSRNHLSAIKKVTEEIILIPSLKTRSADNVLSKFKDSKDARKSLLEIRDICNNFINSDSKSHTELYDLLNHSINESWEIKRRMSNVMDDDLEDQYKILNEIPNNWIRLLGAGSGGYFLLSSKVDFKEASEFLQKKNINFTIAKGCSEGLTSSLI